MFVNRVAFKFCYPALHRFNLSPHSSRSTSSIGQGLRRIIHVYQGSVAAAAGKQA